MPDDDKILETHTKLPPGKSLSEMYKKMLESRPDNYTCAWWKSLVDELNQAYRGLSHTLNLVVATVQEFGGKLTGFEKRVEKVETENALLLQMVGKLQSELTELQDDNAANKQAIADMRAWAKKVKPEKGDTTK